MHRPVTEVSLPPMSTHMYSYTATEPQYVSTRIPNQGWLYINSQDSPPGTDRSNYTVGTSEIMATAMARIKVLGFATYWNIPNVNPRNDVISFYSSNSAPGFPGNPTSTNLGPKFTTAPLVDRWYNINVPADQAALNADIIAKLNALVGLTGLTFSLTPVVGFPQTFILSAAGGAFILDPTSPAVAKGQQMFGFTQLPASQLVQASFVVATPPQTFNFAYTQFVDIISSQLTKWDKMLSTSTGRISPLVIRAYVGGQQWGLQFQELNAHLVEISWKADEPLTTFDIRFFDMNGDPLYVPNGGKDFIWQLSLLAEM
jgi:hypothetical protein